MTTSPSTAPRTMFAKVWDQHVVASLADDIDLLYVDRHFLHDLSGPFSMRTLSKRQLPVRRPDLTWALPDHGVSTEPGRTADSSEASAKLLPLFRSSSSDLGIRLFDLDDDEQGIVHVVGPEQGLSLPGTTVVCGDSHTCTQGGIGALAWGIGNTEVTQVLATQTLNVQRPRTMLVDVTGDLAPHVSAKDLILHLIARDGADGGTGFAIEYGGDTVERMSVEGRLTLCNLSVEFGARMGFVAPDDTTFAYLAGRPHAPSGDEWQRAVAAWRDLRSDAAATFDRTIQVDATTVAPQISWGTSPAHTIAVDEPVPPPTSAPDGSTAAAWAAAADYMAVEPGRPIVGLPVQHVFIGSCTNSRIEDLRAAAAVVDGRRVASTVRAWVVPGSQSVKRQAEREGLDDVFRAAGFAWREPGCSMCMSMNGDTIPAGERCVSTSNRNFVGRQGPGARTHLASPATAAASAITGAITDVREFGR
jgi:3-isopropylmalate/(R)-2-methylmalate dehydratase large subunit